MNVDAALRESLKNKPFDAVRMERQSSWGALLGFIATMAIVFLGFFVGFRYGLEQINIPSTFQEINELSFIDTYQDVVEIQASEILTNEISSWGTFELVGKKRTYRSSEVILPAIAADHGNRTVHVITEVIAPDRYVISTREGQAISFIFEGEGNITAHLSRTSYNAQFGKDQTGLYMMLGSFAGFLSGMGFWIAILLYQQKKRSVGIHFVKDPETGDVTEIEEEK